MASSRPLTRRRRSQSTSTTSTVIRRSPDNSWKVAHKRAHSQYPLDPQLSHQHDMDEWRQGKRRRRNISPSSCNPMQVANAQRSFATTSAEFHLFPNRSTSAPRSHHALIDAGSSCDIDCEVDAGHDFNDLRSHAFKELHQSVAENGESFIQRMRNYERKRALQETSGHRGRKQFTVSSSAPTGNQHLFFHIADTSDTSSACPDRGGRTLSPDDSPCFMELDQDENGNHSPLFPLSCSATDLDDTHFPPSDDEDYVFIHSMDSSPITPELSQSQTDSMASSVISLPSIHSLGITGARFNTRSVLPSRSERALAALTLAITNGAGSINDYTGLQAAHSSSPIDHCQVGELWQ